MRRTKKQILIFLIFLAAFLFSVQLLFIHTTPVSEAAGWLERQTGFGTTGDIPKSFGETGTPSDVRVITAKVVRAFLGVLGIIFVFLIVLAGFKWMTAEGNEEKITEAKEQIIRAFIGLAIILMAWSITTFVMNCVYEATGASTFNWYCLGF